MILIVFAAVPAYYRIFSGFAEWTTKAPIFRLYKEI
jgi:hypothetical protein